MTKRFRKLSLDQAATYQITVQGRLDQSWTSMFDGLDIELKSTEDQPAVTFITARVSDQASLHGMLDQIRDLGLPLLALEIMQIERKELSDE